MERLTLIVAQLIVGVSLNRCREDVVTREKDWDGRPRFAERALGSRHKAQARTPAPRDNSLHPPTSPR
ncbi:hypothetical protein RV134_260207 [Roseovarius sp. EC-HK134]|nr:hypothetical protein RV134_260207 [Roseovarius sp. EC-HK134]VVT10095.1 hypothetical protein RV420_290423 [Roseovarius sp. EC-SD190]